MDFLDWCIIFCIPLLIIVFYCKIKYDTANSERRRSEANKILEFCKDSHNFKEIKNDLYEIAKVSYTDLFDVGFDFGKANITDDTEMTILLYLGDKELQGLLYAKVDEPYICKTKIGVLKLKDKE